MDLFIDSADIDEIKEVLAYGILEGVTTNPSLIKKALDSRKKKGEKVNLESYIKKLLKICKGKSVSLEVVGNTYEDMLSEALTLNKKFGRLGKIYVKIPVNPCFTNKCDKGADGIKTIRALTRKGVKVNCTLVFTPEQALLAAKAGAKYVSPFAGRIDDLIRQTAGIKFDKTDYFPKSGLQKKKKVLADQGIKSGVDLIEQIRKEFDKQGVKCKVLAASLRNKRQFREVALAGSDIATVPYKVIKTLLAHVKTREGMRAFAKDTVPEYAALLKTKKSKKKVKK
tara:strand:- start:6238 stop:7086 length:849 start_codon:yes stop_codon:yes gene_type:complete